MGQIDFNSFKQRITQNSQNNGGRTSNDPRIGYFSLKQDKDQAIVRFMVDSPEDFDIVAGHRMNINGANRMVSCIRNLQDPVEACPLCAAGKKLEYRIYIHLIEYTRDEEGRIVATPKVWERSTAYINTLTNLLNEYGPLSDNIFKVTRNGAAGTTATTYDITYCKPEVYKPALYPKSQELFEGYKVVGRAVLEYNYDQLAEMLDGSSKAPTETKQTTSPEPSTTFRPSSDKVNSSEGWAGSSGRAVNGYSTAGERTAPSFTTASDSQTTMPGRRMY